jgi:hypothetical protein
MPFGAKAGKLAEAVRNTIRQNEQQMTLGETPAPLNERRLSKEFRVHSRALFTCQICGVEPDHATNQEPEEVGLGRWQEHDDADNPEAIVVVLCKECSDGAIKAHPRLYRRLAIFEPFPGAMRCCVHCKWQKELGCTNPAAKSNGGAGVMLKFPKPSTGFWDGADPKTGKRTGGPFLRYVGAVECRNQEIQ